MTCRPVKIIQNQRGSVINVALLILILIFLIGIGLSKMSTTDIKIASNLKTQATTFYQAEGALDTASELLELNVACATGFQNKITTDAVGNQEIIEGIVFVRRLDFWRKDFAGSPAGNPDRNIPIVEDDQSVALWNIDAFSPPDYDPSVDPDAPHTNFSIGGATRFSRGSAIQMAAGYEGLGKGSAGGGANIIYDIRVMRYGAQNSSAEHTIQWIHKLGLGGSCQY